ncbi:MAG TPA: twin-arginine translocation signal domain-containing protein [Candidatus Marinimicrobia bacterium]|nr:twin-arginine translocation signal domain-containing protein [Candidatus Neomarinimicrobiota bacterium]HIB26088.1 twin-arginine translocation signal domain-containing protein [Candidatus Neomarinimicrobiota bacterium]HIM74051.1 twin-arginine translocation signal domain-containing protein [Candidatus Neomarinimicrobiota bacterium]
MTREVNMPDNEKQQQGGQTRRQFLKAVAVGSGAVAAGAALPAYGTKEDSRRDDPELDRIQAVLKDCGSEFGNIRRDNRE